MDLFNIFIYSLIQSLCEFFPISSSGHLALLHKFLQIKDPGVEFDLFLHFASLMAIILYFRKKLFLIFKSFFNYLKKEPYDETLFKVFKALALVTFFSVISILILKGYSEQWGRAPLIIALNLIVFGVLLYVIDKFFQSHKTIQDFSFKEFLLIGFAQALAIFPGVSRSGVTITFLRSLKIKREEAAEFSFLMAIPIIFAGALYKLLPFVMKSSQYAFTIPLKEACIAFFMTFLLSYLFMALFLRVVRKISFLWFAIYRLLLGLLVISYNL